MLSFIDNKFTNYLVSNAKSCYYNISDRIKLYHGRRLFRDEIYTKQDKVSVIIPTFNRIDLLLKRALPSVLGQTHKNLEVLVVSHGCSDGTEKEINLISQKDSRVKLVKISREKLGYPNRADYHWFAGPVKPINAGLKAVTGKWVARIDDDDIWELTHIENSLKTAITNELEFVSSCYQIGIDKEVRIIAPEGLPPIGGVQTWMYRAYLKTLYANIDCWRKRWNRVNDTDIQDRFRKIKLRIGHTLEIGATILPRDNEVEVGLRAYLNSKAKYEAFYSTNEKN